MMRYGGEGYTEAAVCVGGFERMRGVVDMEIQFEIVVACGYENGLQAR